jgi:hypothetical protein
MCFVYIRERVEGRVYIREKVDGWVYIREKVEGHVYIRERVERWVAHTHTHPLAALATPTRCARTPWLAALATTWLTHPLAALAKKKYPVEPTTDQGWGFDPPGGL